MSFSFNEVNKKEMRFYVSTGTAIFTAVALYETLKFQAKIYTNTKKR